MEASNLKNMVVLKNLPSNLVEEAIVILKENKKVKKLQKIEKSKKLEGQKKFCNEKDYILKEAELVVADYIIELENKKKNKEKMNAREFKKLKKLKTYAYFASLIIFIETLILIISK